METLIYALCSATSAACAVLLLRSYSRTRFRLLMWSGLCFAMLTANNLLLMVDRLVFTEVDLSNWRFGTAFVGVMLLLCGLILESRS
ncbi:MAG: DUF5985 family protein [Caldimonas sp.]